MSNIIIPKKGSRTNKSRELEAFETLRHQWHERANTLLTKGQQIDHPSCAQAQTLYDLLQITPDINNHKAGSSQLIALHEEIQDLRDEEITLWPEEHVMKVMNKTHAVSFADGKIIYLKINADGTFTYETMQSFKERYHNRRIQLPNGKVLTWAEIWLRSPDRREYNEMAFVPTTDPQVLKELENQGKFNIFIGFTVKPRRGSGIILKFWLHVRDNICSGNLERYTYLRKWFAIVIQRPELVHTSVILTGKQGTGKNILVESIGRLLGPHFSSLGDISGLIDRFDYHLAQAILVLISETELGNDNKAMAKIKSRITEPKQSFEPKGRDRITLPNFMHIIFCSNSTSPLPLATDTRRFFVLLVSDQRRNQHAYFKEIIDELDHGGLEILLADLLDEPLDGFNPRIMPYSDTTLNMKMENMNSAERYIIDVLREGRFNPSSTEPAESYHSPTIKASLYNQYNLWCCDNGDSHKMVNMETFSKAIKGLIPSVDLTKRIGKIRCYVLPNLEAARQECCDALDTDYEQLFGDHHDETM